MNRFIKDFKRYYNYISYSTKSELKSEVANSHLSWLWWILDPLLFMLVYSFISIIVFGKSEQYFPIYVFIGLNCWQFFEKTVKQSVKLDGIADNVLDFFAEFLCSAVSDILNKQINQSCNKSGSYAPPNNNGEVEKCLYCVLKADSDRNACDNARNAVSCC